MAPKEDGIEKRKKPCARSVEISQLAVLLNEGDGLFDNLAELVEDRPLILTAASPVALVSPTRHRCAGRGMRCPSPVEEPRP